MNLVNVDYEKSEISTKKKKKKKYKTKKTNHNHTKEHGYLLWSRGNGLYLLEPIKFCTICGNIYLTVIFANDVIKIDATNEEILKAIGLLEENVKVFKTNRCGWDIKNVFEECEFVGISYKEKASED